MILPVSAHSDSLAIDGGFGQGTKPFYGADYQFVKDIPYADISLTGNSQYVQPYISFGLQLDHVNVGLGQALTFSRTDGSVAYGIGPELGYVQNVTDLFCVKENNALLFSSGSLSFSATFSFGINL